MATALAGNLLGIAAYALATLLGLALLLAAAPSVRLLVYLLGASICCGSGHGCCAADCTGRRHWRLRQLPRVPRRRLAPSQGILTALSNVQALFFLASIFASVGLLQANLATGLVGVAIIIIGNGCYLSLLAWLMQKPAARRFYARYRPMLEVGIGALFVLFGRGLCRRLAGWL